MCQYADWFMMRFEPQSVPEGWPEACDHITRYAHKTPFITSAQQGPRLRVAAIFFGVENDTPPESAPEYFGVEGHFIMNKDGNPYMPNLNAGAQQWDINEGTCPVNENVLYLFGCIGGHYYADEQNRDYPDGWGDKGPAFAHYKLFWDDPENGLYPPKDYAGEGYYYWHASWPYWAMHPPAAGDDPIIRVDFVDMPFPP